MDIKNTSDSRTPKSWRRFVEQRLFAEIDDGMLLPIILPVDGMS
jgi:hypothetical protein